MTDTTPTAVLICGAGATGLTLALELARRHIPFQLIEQRRSPFHGSRGKGIQPRTQEIFEDLGILDRVVAAGGMYPQQRVYQRDGSVTDTPSAEVCSTPAEPYQLPLMIPQSATEQLMRERLLELGHDVRFGTTLDRFTQDATGVTAWLTHESGDCTMRAQYLIGADGGRSGVRHALAIGFPGHTLGVRAMVADVSLQGLSREVWHHFNDRAMDTYLSVCPLAGTALFQLQAPIPLEGDMDLSADGLTALVRERTQRTDIVIDSVSWASAYTMQARLADSYRVDRVLLAGDAAHIHPPTGGQGLNTSVQDGYNLAWKLAAVIQGADPALLDTFEEERRPIAAAMLGLTTGLLEDAKRGSRRRGREVHQLDLGYPASSLAVNTPARPSGIRAGERAPDAPLRGAGGQAVRLFGLFQGPHWTLLGYEAARSAAPRMRPGLRIHTIGTAGDLRDDGHFRDSYGVAAGEWVLVRPDGYIGAVVAPNDMALLEPYLAAVGLAPTSAG